MGMDFGRLLEKESEEEEQRSSNPPSRTTSRNTSVTSLSSLKSNTSEKNDPVEVSVFIKRKKKNNRYKLNENRIKAFIFLLR